MTNLKQEILKNFTDNFTSNSNGEIILRQEDTDDFLTDYDHLKDFLSQAIDRVIEKEREAKIKVVYNQVCEQIAKEEREKVLEEVREIIGEDEKLKYGRAGAIGKTIRECELFHYGEKAGRNQLRKQIRERLSQITNLKDKQKN